MSTTVGQQLRQRRQERSLSIEQASLATRIKPHYLQALEDGELDKLPSMAHARGFLRAYAGYLGLDEAALLAILDNKAPAATAGGAGPMGSVLAADTNGDEAGSPAAGLEASGFEGNGHGPAGGDSAASSEAAAIFTELGEQLKRQRELLGLSLEDVERHTHVRERYLLALEAGSLDDLPSPVQGRGMLNNYAAFLGMNPDPLLLRFAEGLQARLSARQAAQQTAQAAARRRKRRWLPRRLRRLLSGDVLIGGVLTVFLGVVVLWISIRIFAITSTETSTPTAPSIAQVLLSTPSPTLAATGEALTPTPPVRVTPTQLPATDPVTGLLTTPNPEGGLQVHLNVRQRAWLRVVVDGIVELEERVIPGSAYPFTAEDTVEVTTGSGSAIQVFVNGTDMGLMGSFGQAVSRIYSAEGLITPTPTITPTPGPTTAVPPTQASGTELPSGEQPAVP